MRGEYKTPGGKLVGVNVDVDDAGTVTACHLDGDFFIDGGDDQTAEQLISSIETALVEHTDPNRVLAHFPTTHLIGIDTQAILTAFDRALAAIANHPQPQKPDSNSPRIVPPPDPHGNDHAAHVGHTADPAYITEQWQQRWPRLHLRVVHDQPRMPEDQMKVDEQWAREVAAGKRDPTLRLWEWAAATVVIGRFQSIPDEVNLVQARREGVSVVRRCTGGGAMFIEPGNTITYSLYVPKDFVRGFTIADSYQLCDQWLVRALRSLGLDVRFSGLNDIASQHGKIGGAAQRRFPTVDGGPGSVLHHVTLAYDIDAEKMGRILHTSREKLSDKAVRSAVKRVDPMRSQTGMGREEIVQHLLNMAAE